MVPQRTRLPSEGILTEQTHLYLFFFNSIFFLSFFLSTFIWLRRVVVASWGNLPLQHTVPNCGRRAPEHTGSAVVMLGLSWSMPRGILVP